ncbi:DEAD/DEAH box helicase [Mycoplasma mycoides]|uniref:DEAD/DEAH box helicase n=1 Tax=Mycoplasma mycoides TaxID=2102 RepID=UPI0010175225|nr:DEAD/DEAH box helicase [Mycoplasma mycoides]SRX67601.1 ATP-dependent helicase [Mycoplasma mycoides subsp. capri]
MKFTDFGFKKYIIDTLDQIEFIAPTSIQQKVIPLALAHTGTGKTHSFLLPILNNLKLEENDNYVQAVIISPTRELSLQIYQNTKLFLKNNPLINCNLFIGGEDISKNIEQLEKKQPHIVIGTPTRLKELYDLNKLRLTTTSYFIIDECDMIFDLGFIEDVDYLISKINQDVTIGIFSATISQQLSVFCKKYIKNAHFIDDSQNKISTSNVKHVLIDTKNKELEQSLIQIINSINPFNEFKYLVATDVASRGVDIKGVSHIISINLPSDLTYYIHRSGRTGRNNSTGYSYIIYNLKNKTQIEELIKKGIEFETKKLIDNQLVDIKTNYKKVKVFKELDAESKQVINKYKNKKVKPNYKKKRKQELDKIKQKIRRKHIKENIEKIKKAKYQKRRAELFD